jgi:hypothetical protein
MSASNEWTEWHLTPRGWERGTEKEDFNVIRRDAPNDRFLTVKWYEYLGYSMSKMQKGHDEIWRSSDEQKVNEYIIKFGEAPKSL